MQIQAAAFLPAHDLNDLRIDFTLTKHGKNDTLKDRKCSQKGHIRERLYERINQSAGI